MILFRRGLTRCSMSRSRCSIPNEYVSEYGPQAILARAGLIASISTDFPQINIQNQTDDFYGRLLWALQDPGVPGDLYSAGAGYDPLFWVLFGIHDRLLGLKRILASEHLFFDDNKVYDESWGYNGTIDDLEGGRCDWSLVNGPDDLTLPTCSPGSF